MARSQHKPGVFGNAPVNGRYFFIHRASRSVRTWDMDSQPVPKDWEQVTLEEWLQFRKETAAMPPKKRRALHATLYGDKPCKSNSSLSSKPSSTPVSTARATKKPRKKSTPAGSSNVTTSTTSPTTSNRHTSKVSSTTASAPKASRTRSRK